MCLPNRSILSPECVMAIIKLDLLGLKKMNDAKNSDTVSRRVRENEGTNYRGNLKLKELKETATPGWGAHMFKTFYWGLLIWFYTSEACSAG